MEAAVAGQARAGSRGRWPPEPGSTSGAAPGRTPGRLRHPDPDGRLRGCIGYIEGIKPLVEAVVDNGRSAAVGDPRFPPVQARNWRDLDLEISALTPLGRSPGRRTSRSDATASFWPSRAGGRSSCPRWPREQGWDLDTTLTHLALKAGLAPDTWRQGREFQVFEAEVF